MRSSRRRRPQLAAPAPAVWPPRDHVRWRRQVAPMGMTFQPASAELVRVVSRHPSIEEFTETLSLRLGRPVHVSCFATPEHRGVTWVLSAQDPERVTMWPHLWELASLLVVDRHVSAVLRVMPRVPPEIVNLILGLVTNAPAND